MNDGTVDGDIWQCWLSARERMEMYIDAVFVQDLKIYDEGRIEQISWILDEIIRPEYLGALNNTWSVWRMDDNGQYFEITSGISFQDAQRMVAEYELKGHKQYYWAKPSKLSVSSPSSD